MDLFTVVAVSMLPASRSRVAATFSEISRLSIEDPIEAVLDACRLPSTEWGALAAVARERAALALDAAKARGILALSRFDPRYPTLLSAIPDPPPVLWVRGDPGALSRPTVAIVGSRAATPYARDVGYRLAGDLAGHGIVIASGLARGVDSSGHQGCLDAGGATVAVLGSGPDYIYPAEHASLATNICEHGALVSELGPGAVPLAEHFPLRNRIISGISLAVVIVEASEKSGSLITARYALEQGRDVMAVPGNVLSGRNRGSHSLLKDGAKVVESAVDILEDLGWPSITEPLKSSKLLTTDPLVARMEPGEVYGLEALASLTGLSGQKLLPRLTELELRGVLVGAGIGRYRRVE